MREEREVEMWKHPRKAAHFAFPLRDRFIQEGIGFKLTCTIEGYPHPEVRDAVSSRVAQFGWTLPRYNKYITA